MANPYFELNGSAVLPSQSDSVAFGLERICLFRHDVDPSTPRNQILGSQKSTKPTAVPIVAVIGIPLYLAGITGGLTVVAQNIIATLILVVPVTLMLAGLESSPRKASIGKHLRHLLVVNPRTGQRVSFRRALACNTMKIAVPWTIGHAAVYGIVASLFFVTGRTPYDRVSGTTITLAAR